MGILTKMGKEKMTENMREARRGTATTTVRHPGALGGRRGMRMGTVLGSISSVT